MLAKLEVELKNLKDTHPEEYLQLLKTLNRGMEDIATKLEKAIRH